MAIRIDTPLGRDALTVTGLTGRERISTLQQFDVTVKGTDSLAFDALLGAPVTITISIPDSSPRTVTGICTHLTEEAGGREPVYRLEVGPSHGLLARTRRTRIFQDMSFPDIAARVLAGHPVSFRLAGSYPAREYVVQYRESDFDFVSRLLEEEGIWYFSQADGELVLGDHPAAHPELPAIQFDPKGAGTVFAWEKAQRLAAGKHTLWDYDFELPSRRLEAEAAIPAEIRVGGATHRLQLPAVQGTAVDEGPGGFRSQAEGDRLAQVRMQEAVAAALTIAGASTSPTLAAGHRIALTGLGAAFDGSYLVTGVTHRATQRNEKVGYRNEFTCIPDSIEFRPPRVTPRPTAGPETAFVAGPPGETRFADELGRVKVKFHWDRAAAGEHSSAWIRVAQPPATAERGFFSLPEVGDEVLVAFEHGDPSRPVVLGALWNGADRPPEEKREE